MQVNCWCTGPVSKFRKRRVVSFLRRPRGVRVCQLLKGNVVRKVFRGSPQQQFAFLNEVRILRYLQNQGCEFVPRLLAVDFKKRTLYLKGYHGKKVDPGRQTEVDQLVDTLLVKFHVFTRSRTVNVHNARIVGETLRLVDFGSADWTILLEAMVGPPLPPSPPREELAVEEPQELTFSAPPDGQTPPRSEAGESPSRSESFSPSPSPARGLSPAA